MLSQQQWGELASEGNTLSAGIFVTYPQKSQGTSQRSAQASAERI